MIFSSRSAVFVQVDKYPVCKLLFLKNILAWPA